jgi:hypothetical protein
MMEARFSEPWCSKEASQWRQQSPPVAAPVSPLARFPGWSMLSSYFLLELTSKALLDVQ